jgi:PPK2 family polyphosphate:nucleotide phosphotransferase
MASKASSLNELAERFVKPYRVANGKTHFRLRDFDPGDTRGLKSNKHARDLLAEGIALLSEMQEKLYAEDRWSVLLIFQAMDAAGKDSAIKHVMSGINPQGCTVHSFKHPSDEELQHDFLWHAVQHLPERGRIGIFNRSYYEEVLIVRIHQELLKREQLPPQHMTPDIWRDRFDSIVNFEEHLTRSGTVLCKFFLNLSRREQKKRFIERLEEPEKHWKFSLADVRERRFWSSYLEAYEDMIRHTAKPRAPWYVVPADNKWFTRLVVAAVIIQTMADLKLAYPKLDAQRRKEIEQARKDLIGSR